MKQVTFFALCAALVATFTFGPLSNCRAQTATPTAATAPQEVTIYLRNNSVWPQSLTLIGYYPESLTNNQMQGAFNWTQGAFYLPYTSKKFTVAVGTRIYNADRAQVGTVMGGGNLLNSKPLLEVKAEDAGKTFDLN